MGVCNKIFVSVPFFVLLCFFHIFINEKLRAATSFEETQQKENRDILLSGDESKVSVPILESSQTPVTKASMLEHFESQQQNAKDNQASDKDGDQSTSQRSSGDQIIATTAGTIASEFTKAQSRNFEAENELADAMDGERAENVQKLQNMKMQSTRVNCQRLFAGKDEYKNEIETAKAINKSLILQPKDIINETENCEQYRKNRGYVMHSMTAEEEDFPIAFSILMYTDPGQTERLLRAIYRPQNFYCVHVDKKADDATKEAVLSISSCFDNIFVAPNAIDVNWGEWGVMEAEVICMEHLAHFKWKYFINLTGQEFPLATNYKIVKILKIYNGGNEIPFGEIGNRKHIAERYKYIHPLGKRNTHQLRLEPPPANITIYLGSAHVVLSRKFVDYILHDPIPRQFLNWTKLTKIPEEFFFASLQGNTHLKAPGASKEPSKGLHEPISRHKIWSFERRRKKCASGFYRHHLCMYGVEDLPSLFNDDHAFYINKLMHYFEPVTYDCLEELLANRTRDEYLGHRQLDLDFFQKLPFVHNHF